MRFILSINFFLNVSDSSLYDTFNGPEIMLENGFAGNEHQTFQKLLWTFGIAV